MAPRILRAQVGQVAAFVAPAGGISPPSGFPGQLGNPVGFAAAPGYPGSLTSHATTGFTSGTSGSPNIYSFLDINAGTGGTLFSTGLDYVTFIGCRFQSNDSANYNVQISGATNIIFSYCSFTPLASLYTAPPGAAWPSASAGLQTTTQVTDTNCINGNSGYQYGLNIISGGPVSADHCDFWGFGNGGPIFYSTTAAMSVTNCWIHDAANASPQGYHIDGTGYVNGGTPPINVTLTGNTIASIGNTNAIAFQAATSAYNSIIVTDNYLSGFGYNSDMGLPGTGGITNSTFANNVLGTDLPWIFGPIYSDFTTLFSSGGNSWHGNRLYTLPGTSPIAGSVLSWNSSQNGYFVLPNGSLSTVDF